MTAIKYIYNCVEKNGDIFFMSGMYPDLLKLNMDKNSIEMVCKFEWDTEKGNCKLFILEDLIIAASSMGKQVAIYNLLNNESQIYSYGDSTEIDVSQFLIGDEIWFFSRKPGNEIVIFDLVNRCYKKKTIRPKNANYQRNDKELSFAVKNQNKIIFNSIGEGYLWEYDLEDNSIRLIDLPNIEEIYGIEIIDNDLYITSNESAEIYILDLESESITKYVCYESVKRFAKPVKYDKGVLVFNDDGMWAFEKPEFKKIECPKKIAKKNTWFLSGNIFNNQIILLPWTTNYFITLDLISKSIIKSFAYEYYNYNRIFEKHPIFEDVDNSLIKYVAFVSGKQGIIHDW